MCKKFSGDTSSMTEVCITQRIFNPLVSLFCKKIADNFSAV